METVGMRIEALRKSKGWTQKELSDKANYSTVIISRAENSNTITDGLADAYCKLFGCSKAWLLNGEGDAPKGVVVQMRKDMVETPWRDETLSFLKAENQRLWKLVEKLSGAPAGSIANFSNAVGKAGKQISLLPTVKAA